MVCGVIVAAGKSERMGAGIDKAFLSLGARPVLAWSLLAFERCTDINRVVVVVRKERLEATLGLVRMFGLSKVSKVVVGGATRQASVLCGLEALGDEAQLVAVHDGSRPCVTTDLITRTVASARRYGSGVAAVKVVDTLKEVDHGTLVARTVDRSKLWSVQTPQTFNYKTLMKAYLSLQKRTPAMTDESSLLEQSGEAVHLVPSTWANIKITVAEDLAVAT
ncbi:MAG: 2-C-methyl-D-erythritol 4-phosphate cytidylyltransferase, partial [Kiritimatiellia bacterium]